jgi:hypothetical protein
VFERLTATTTTVSATATAVTAAVRLIKERRIDQHHIPTRNEPRVSVQRFTIVMLVFVFESKRGRKGVWIVKDLFLYRSRVESKGLVCVVAAFEGT